MYECTYDTRVTRLGFQKISLICDMNGCSTDTLSTDEIVLYNFITNKLFKPKMKMRFVVYVAGDRERSQRLLDSIIGYMKDLSQNRVYG